MKTYTIRISKSSLRGNHSDRTVYGTVPELTEYFGYTLEVGNSYNSKINTKPKTIRSLISNVQRSMDIMYGNTYTTERIELISD